MFDLAQSTAPTQQFYVFPSVKIVNVPAVSDKDGYLVCATTSTYPTTCRAAAHAELNSTATKVNNDTQSETHQGGLYITGINSNAESYFSSGPEKDSAIISSKLDTIQISFSKPFVYAPLSDLFPSKVVNENLGYVPQSLIEWMAQHSDYVSKFPSIASCIPGGPSIDFSSYFCSNHGFLRPELPGGAFIEFARKTSDLTTSSTVTIAGRGCFHPGACSTPAAPGATAAAATPAATPEAQAHDSMFNLCHIR